MTLKYIAEHKAVQKTKSQEQWSYIENIKQASIGFDKEQRVVVANILTEDRQELRVPLYYEAYLLNDNGETMKKVRI